MRESYLSYAMSVIASRALPDVRDGLKPVQRRILFAMREMGMEPSKQHRKCAGIIGEVLKSFHPHGDGSVYEALVRLAQDFTLRYPLVDGHGNFGSIDPDPPAAYRYTEARLARAALEMLADIDKETVPFVASFDNQGTEPSVLPAKLPQLLVNGSSGIAVGMATNIPPHNLNEIADAAIYLIDHYDACIARGVPFDIVWARAMNLPIDDATLAAAFSRLPRSLQAEISERAKQQAAATGTPVDLGHALLDYVSAMIDVTPDKLMEFVKGPDFPTGGIIHGIEGI